MDHPSEETLKRFVAGAASREENCAVVAHLLKTCTSCAARIRSLVQPEAILRDAYADALERFNRGLLEALDSPFSSVQTLRTVLGRMLDAEWDDGPKRR